MTGRNLAIAVAIVALAAVPYVIGEPYYVNVASQILLYAIFALGLNVLVGYAGLVSLGHAGLFGVASYVVASVLAAGYGHAVAIAAALSIGLPVHRRFRRAVPARDRHQLHHDHAGARRDPVGPGLSLDQPDQRRQRHQRGIAADAVRHRARLGERVLRHDARLFSSPRSASRRFSCARRSGRRFAAPAIRHAA